MGPGPPPALRKLYRGQEAPNRGPYSSKNSKFSQKLKKNMSQSNFFFKTTLFNQTQIPL